MSKADLFAELTNLVDVDPFALLGVSVSADEKRIAKRYRQIAKFLHPDAIVSSTSADLSQPPTQRSIDSKLAAEIIARIVNPSYQKIKQERGRQEALATLRFRVRRLARTEKLVPTFQQAKQLKEIEDNQVDIFYEQTLSHIASKQFQSFSSLHASALEIGQLNLVFLHRKLEISIIRPKRTGLIANTVTPTAALAQVSQEKIASYEQNIGQDSPSVDSTEEPEVDYARQHTARAKTYLSQQNYEMAVQELREALKISPQSPELHSMIGQAYYKQKLSGMAKAHFKQAIKLKPTHKVARKYCQKMGLLEPTVGATDSRTKSVSTSSEKKAWIGRLLHR